MSISDKFIDDYKFLFNCLIKNKLIDCSTFYHFNFIAVYITPIFLFSSQIQQSVPQWPEGQSSSGFGMGAANIAWTTSTSSNARTVVIGYSLILSCIIGEQGYLGVVRTTGMIRQRNLSLIYLINIRMNGRSYIPH